MVAAAPSPNSFAGRASAVVFAKGLDLTQLAASARIKPRRLRRILGMDAYLPARGPTLIEVRNLARILNLHPAYLAWGIDVRG